MRRQCNDDEESVYFLACIYAPESTVIKARAERAPTKMRYRECFIARIAAMKKVWVRVHVCVCVYVIAQTLFEKECAFWARCCYMSVLKRLGG